MTDYNYKPEMRDGKQIGVVPVRKKRTCKKCSEKCVDAGSKYSACKAYKTQPATAGEG